MLRIFAPWGTASQFQAKLVSTLASKGTSSRDSSIPLQPLATSRDIDEPRQIGTPASCCPDKQGFQSFT